MYKLILAGFLTLFCSSMISAEVVPFDSKDWTFEAKEHRIETYKGAKALYLKGGFAYLKNTQFLDGVIEFDVAIPNAFGFMGAIWRAEDLENFEEFYVRSSRSGQPDANQYTPVFNNVTGWQLYHGEGFSAPTKYKFDEWTHVKIVVSGDRGAVYISDMEKPAFVIDKLKREPKAGMLGLKASNFAPARFANFEFKELPQAVKFRTAKPVAKPDAGTIMNYSVSNPFDEKTLKDVTLLGETQTAGLSWNKFQTEPTGLANLARAAKISEGNTVFAKITVESEKEQIKKMQFGYSDRVIVYINGRPLYSGNNAWRSRDFRYLGTIGYFDEVYLPLKRGSNEILLAVSESFGGWGVQTRFPDLDGIKIK